MCPQARALYVSIGFCRSLSLLLALSGVASPVHSTNFHLHHFLIAACFPPSNVAANDVTLANTAVNAKSRSIGAIVKDIKAGMC
jgi:hypothetical protein